MEEFRNAHRLLRRFALLAAIHGFSATAVGEHLYAADHSLPPSSVDLVSGMGQDRVNHFVAAEAVEFAPTHSAILDAVDASFDANKPETVDTALQPPLHVPMPLPTTSELDAVQPKRLPKPVAEMPVPLPPPPGPRRLPSTDKSAPVVSAVSALPSPRAERSAVVRSPRQVHSFRPVTTRNPETDSFTALAAMSQSPTPWIQPHLELPEPEPAPVAATMNSSKLRDMARESLRDANSRLQRNATHSAHKIASEALELLIAMSDAREGGTQHARQLESAISAIRESKDFWGTRGPIDHDTLVRSIAVHETNVLQGKMLENTSALDASAIYLAFAKDQLALAGKSVPEASDALVLLGQIEKQLADPSDPHTAAVALTMHRAAVAVDSSNGYCRRELGKALLDQGLNDEAIQELKIANEYKPTRAGYQSLREAALRVGDNQLANQCINAMNDRRLQSDSPVLRLPPEQFAATHRPSAIDLNRSASSSTNHAALQNNSPKILAPQVTDKKSWFPFGRR